MSSFKEINIETWKRKIYLKFFKGYDDPFFNITTHIDIGSLPEFTKENKLSFNLACLFYSQKVINSIPEFKTRFDNNKILEFDEVKCGSTILMPDNTFRFCYFNNSNNIFEFDRIGKENIKELIESKDFNPRDEELNMIHYSTLPWISFTSIKHPRKFTNSDSIPKIVFGKWFEQSGKKLMPVSVDVHHSLLDGFHIGMYFDDFTAQLKEL